MPYALAFLVVCRSAANDWIDANILCAQDGATLASIHSDSENSAIQLLGFEADVNQMWIGINDLDVSY